MIHSLLVCYGLMVLGSGMIVTSVSLSIVIPIYSRKANFYVKYYAVQIDQCVSIKLAIFLEMYLTYSLCWIELFQNTLNNWFQYNTWNPFFSRKCHSKTDIETAREKTEFWALLFKVSISKLTALTLNPNWKLQGAAPKAYSQKMSSILRNKTKVNKK